VRINGNMLSNLAVLAGLVADEKMERSGVYGVLHFLNDGYVIGSNGYLDIEVKNNLNGVEPFSVPASKFGQAIKLVNKNFEYDLSVTDKRLVVEGPGVSIKFNLVEGKLEGFQRLSGVFAGKNSNAGLNADKISVLPRLLKIALAGDSMVELRTLLFKSDSVFATDRVRIAGYFSKLIDIEEDGALIITATGLQDVIGVMQGRSVVSVLKVGNRVCMDVGDGMYVGLLSYDTQYPDIMSIVSKNRDAVSEFIKLDETILEPVKDIVRVVDSDDVISFIVENGELRIEIASMKGIEWKQSLVKVKTENEYKAKVLARDLDGVIGGVVELGFAGDTLYAKSVEGVEYIIACVL